MNKEELQALLNGKKPQGEDKTKQRRVQHEGMLQMACVKWFRLQYPAFSHLLFHPKNESDGATSGKKIAINAATGVVPGVPDLILALPAYQTEQPAEFPHRAFIHGLGIELKNGKRNNQSAHQQLFQQYWEAAGYQYALVRSLEDFITTVRDYMDQVPFSAKQEVKLVYHSDPDTEANKKLLAKIAGTKPKDGKED